MNWYIVDAEFKQKFPDYIVEVLPPCISSNRESQYICEAKAIAIGRLNNGRTVDIDTKKKVITFLR